MRVTTRERNSRSWETRTTPARRPRTNPSRRCEPGEVEVVGGLVEQHHVEAAEQQRGQRGSGGLPAGQGGHQRVRADVEAEVGQHRREALVEVRGAAGLPVVEAVRVGVLGAAGVLSVAERRWRPAPWPRSPRRPRCGGRRSGRRSRRRRARAPGAASPRRRRGAPSRPSRRAGSRSPARIRSRVVLPAPLAPTTPTTSPGATVRSSDSKRVRCAWPPARFLATRSALIRRS